MDFKEEQYFGALIDELQRIGDLLEYQARLKMAELVKLGVTDLPRQGHRRAGETRSAGLRSPREPEQS